MSERRAVEAVVAIAALVVIGVLALRPGTSGPPSVTASSSRPHHGPEMATQAHGTSYWQPSGHAVGSWISMQWGASRAIRRVTLQRADIGTRGEIEGFLSFSDGSRIFVDLRSTAALTTLPISPRTVDSVRFTVAGLLDGAPTVGLSVFGVSDRLDSVPSVEATTPDSGDLARLATVTTSAGGDTAAVHDGSTRTAATVGGSIRLTWPRPRELDSIWVSGATRGGEITSGTVVFSDGSTLPLGAVLEDPGRPTVLSFMPRVTTSVSITLVTGGSPPALAEIAAFQPGGPAFTPAGATTPTPAAAAPACAQQGAQPSDADGVVVLCPLNSTEVGDSVRLAVAAGPGYRSVSAVPWDSQSTIGAPAPTVVSLASGTADIALDVSALPSGPFTVRLTALGGPSRSPATYLQLIHEDGSSPAAVTQQPAGRTLVYQDNFTKPLSVSLDGTNADYAAAKPTDTGTQGFGSAIFADPALGFGNVQTVDGVLDLAVRPDPAGYTDPDGYGRQSIGGMLASARPGGSGFAAQYGYFEARMLAPVGPGTWPAFWMLPDPNLVSPQSAVAEVDATELYGVNPVGACESTHQYPDPAKVGVARCGTRWSSDRAALAWHTYAADVSPAGVTYYIDGQDVATAPPVADLGAPLFFMLDMDLGGGWPVDLSATQGRADLYVSWVRVYE